MKATLPVKLFNAAGKTDILIRSKIETSSSPNASFGTDPKVSTTPLTSSSVTLLGAIRNAPF
jgi:hypothetical protein